MGRVYDDISEEQARWIGEQPMFFVATAAPDAQGPEKMAEYRAVKNTRSIDGLPGLGPKHP